MRSPPELSASGFHPRNSVSRTSTGYSPPVCPSAVSGCRKSPGARHAPALQGWRTAAVSDMESAFSKHSVAVNPYFISTRNRHLATHGELQSFTHILGVVGVRPQQVHHLGDGCLQRDVVASDNADAVHLTACLVLAHHHRAGFALRHIQHGDSTLQRIVHGVDKPFLSGCVARPESLDNYTVQVLGIEDGIDHLRCNAGEQFQHRDVAVEALAHFQRFGTLWQEQ